CSTTSRHPSFYRDCSSDVCSSELRAAQCDFPGAIMTLDLHGGKKAAFSFLRSLHILRDAVSLGGVESLACHPRTTTHSELSPEEIGRAAGRGMGEERGGCARERHR